MKFKCFSLKSVVMLLFIIFNGCNEYFTDSKLDRISGYSLSFDDNYISDWYGIADLLISNEVKATFFVSDIGEINESEITQLKELNNLGFEIGSHGFHHTNAVQYLNNHTLDEYYEYEIKPSINFMDSLGFRPTSFAYPFGRSSDTLDNFLLNYFKILRHVTIEQLIPSTKEAQEIDEIYYKSDGSRLIAGLGIDINYGVSLEELRQAFQRTLINNEIIILFAHRPVDSSPAAYETQIAFLDSVFKLANEFNLKNYKFSELPDLHIE